MFSLKIPYFSAITHESQRNCALHVAIVCKIGKFV